MGDCVCQFMVLSFSLNIAPRVLIQMIKPVARALSQQRVEVLMYHNDWLLQASTHNNGKLISISF